jgi:hypothetical protein
VVTEPPSEPPEIFIVYGRDDAAIRVASLIAMALSVVAPLTAIALLYPVPCVSLGVLPPVVYRIVAPEVQ